MAADPVAASVAPPRSLLDDAWSFACAITHDDDDRSRSQATVVQAWLEAGAVTQAAGLASHMQGWRKLAGYADVAAALARAGRTNDAVRFLLEAEYQVPGVEGWPYDRVQMRIARAKAYLGRTGEVESLARLYIEHRECRAEARTALAIALVRAGRIEEALTAFDGLPEPDLFDAVVSRTSGFRDMAAAADLPAGKRRELLERAWAESLKVAGWRQTDLQYDLVAQARDARLPSLERAWLQHATASTLTAGIPDFVRAGQIAQAAAAWGRLGDTNRLAQLEAAFRAGPQKSIELIAQPAPLARIAEGYRLAGDTARSDALFAEAFAIAGALVNPRPRALACVEVLLAMARARAPERLIEEPRREVLAGLTPRAS